MRQAFAVIGLLGVLAAIHFFSLKNLYVTYDEWSHLRYGIRMLKGNSDRLDDSKTPITVLNAVPFQYFKKYSREDTNSLQYMTSHLWQARWVTVFFSLILGLVVYAFSRDIYGPLAGLFSLALYVFEPTVTAHSQLVTNDLYSALTITLSVYTFWKFLSQGGFARGLVCALFLGLSQVAKYSAIFLYPLFCIIAYLH